MRIYVDWEPERHHPDSSEQRQKDYTAELAEGCKETTVGSGRRGFHLFIIRKIRQAIWQGGFDNRPSRTDTSNRPGWHIRCPGVGDEPTLICFAGRRFKRERAEGVSLAADNNQALLIG